MTTALPRIVIVTRPTPLEHMLQRLGTPGQVRFFLEQRGQRYEDYEHSRRLRDDAVAAVSAAIPSDQSRTRVDRSELERFVFRGNDIVVIVGQDGLVANVSKYLDGHLVVGVNPDLGTYDGVLCRHEPDNFGRVLAWTRDGGPHFRVQRRTMAEATREDGQRMTALNEFYFGSGTHQSARYTLHVDGRTERQSSSGVLVVTGTGATGWGLSVARQRDMLAMLPKPEERSLAWFVREPFPSVSTGTELQQGTVERNGSVEAVSEMGEGGVIFADGIESDYIEFLEGHRVTIGMAKQNLNLVIPNA
jgi:hypothetical protein